MKTALWFGMLGGPFAAFGDVLVSTSYLDTRLGLFLAALAAAGVAVMAGGLSWWSRRWITPIDEADRIRRLGQAGVSSASFALLVIGSLLLPKLLLPLGSP
jgi:hypothetical protein